MPDHYVTLPDNFISVQANEPGCSPTRYVAAALANIVEIVQPGKVANPQSLVSRLYQQATGQPDLPSNTIGITKAQALSILADWGIVTIDMADQFGNIDALKHEIQAQNLANVFQLFVLNDASKLTYGRADGQPGPLLHNWPGVASGCALLRVGYSDSIPIAYYIDADLSPAFQQPIPLRWDSVEGAGLLSCIAILPKEVTQAPPASFRYFAGVDAEDNLLTPNPWPVPVPPKPTIDADEFATTINALRALDQQTASAREQVLTHLAGLVQSPPAPPAQ